MFVLIEILNLWLTLAFINLAHLCYTDLLRREVDQRQSAFMNGAGIFAALLSGLGWWYLLIALITIGFNKALTKLNKRYGTHLFASGDQTILLWVLPGLILMGVVAPAVFMIVLTILLTLILLIQKRFNNILGKHLPGAIIITIALLIMLGIFL